MAAVFSPSQSRYDKKTIVLTSSMIKLYFINDMAVQQTKFCYKDHHQKDKQGEADHMRKMTHNSKAKNKKHGKGQYQLVVVYIKHWKSRGEKRK